MLEAFPWHNTYAPHRGSPARYKPSPPGAGAEGLPGAQRGNAAEPAAPDKKTRRQGRVRSYTVVQPCRFTLSLAPTVGGSAGHVEIDGLRAFAATIRLRVVADLLVLGQSVEAGRLNGGDMNEDISAAIVRLDEAEAFIRVEKLYYARFGHASGPFFLCPKPRAALQFALWAIGRQVSSVRKGPVIHAPCRFLQADTGHPENFASPVRIYS